MSFTLARPTSEGRPNSWFREASRVEPRDFVDTAAALERYTVEQIIGFARRLDPGLTDRDFAEAAERLDHWGDGVFASFGLGRRPQPIAVTDAGRCCVRVRFDLGCEKRNPVSLRRSWRVAGRRRAEDGPDPVPSKRQQQILDFIQTYVKCHGVSPSYREIGDAVGLKSSSTVKYQVGQLQEKGYLTRRDRMPRTIVQKPRHLRKIELGLEEASADPGSDDTVSMPFFESIAAGGLAYANPEAVGTIRLPRDMVGSGNLFAVSVTGDSMVGAGIFDGDYVVVREQNDAVNGDIVAARFGDEATVKTFLRTEDHVWLMPENPSYEPIPGDRCEIMGKVVATLHSRRNGR